MADCQGTVRSVDEADGRWVRLVLDAPRGNLLSLDLVRQLDAALDEVGRRRGLRWLTIEGTRGEFSFGAMLQEHLPTPMREVLPATHAMLRRLLALPVPTAALVEGRCLGGGFELALCCDEILAAADATFGLPEVRVGAFPPVSAIVLPLKVGTARAARAMLAGVPESAAEWAAAGLLTLVDAGRPVVEAAGHWFDLRLAGHSAVALGHVALAARDGVRRQVDAALPELERRYLDELLGTHDAVEGVRAWLDKRTPRWEDR